MGLGLGWGGDFHFTADKLVFQINAKAVYTMSSNFIPGCICGDTFQLKGLDSEFPLFKNIGLPESR